MMQRRAFLQSTSLLSLAGTIVPAAARGQGIAPAKRVPAAAPIRAAHQNRAPLAVQPLLPLPVGSIKPKGWLRRQLEIQTLGLGGRLDETWPDVGPNSGWLGGTGEARALEPMPSADRKVIHDALTDNADVVTRSEGDDPFRRIVIAPANG